MVGAGSVEVIDYAAAPTEPVSRGPLKKGILGGLAGAVLACGVLVLLFLLDRKVDDIKELEQSDTPPVLATIRRMKKKTSVASDFLLGPHAARDQFESYAKLRMNLMYALRDKEHGAVVVTSTISGEGKSTIAANLAVSCAMSCGRVLLVDADMRRGCQAQIFNYDEESPGLFEALTKKKDWRECVLSTEQDALDVLPAGHLPSDPAELMASMEMSDLLKELNEAYKLVLIDVPPINIVSDPLMLSDIVTGCLFVVRQSYTDHREIRKALIAAEMTRMEVLGFVFYGERTESDRYYAKKYYDHYYHNYEDRALADDGREKKGARLFHEQK